MATSTIPTTLTGGTTQTATNVTTVSIDQKTSHIMLSSSIDSHLWCNPINHFCCKNLDNRILSFAVNLPLNNSIPNVNSYNDNNVANTDYYPTR